MNIFFILVGVSVVGIVIVFWLLKNDDNPSLRDLGAEKKEAMATVPLPGAADFVEKSFEEKKIEQEINFTAQIEEWREKYKRLDKLFNEKSAALEKSEESLRNELSNRKEFNKLKDMLEKELREAKDKARSIQVELNAARTEAEGNRKRIAQLEDKVTTMEKVIRGKDNEIAAPVAVVPAEPPVVSPAQTPEPEQGKAAGEPQQPKEEGFLKLQPDILAAADTADPEIKKSDPDEPKQSSDPVLPEADPQGPQDKPVSEGQTDQRDEQKKE